MRIFSGIQPTGAKHFGNYSGGFRQYVATAEQNEAFFCVVDLHSISVPYDPVDFRNTCLDLAAMLFATGLDPEHSTVFIQSHVTAHARRYVVPSSSASLIPCCSVSRPRCSWPSLNRPYPSRHVKT